MSISGHRTVSMFHRSNITSDDDKREALRRTKAHLAALPEEPRVVAIAGQDTEKPPSEKKNGPAPEELTR
jgi:hypothetical protein